MYKDKVETTLFEQRIVQIWGEISDEIARNVISQLKTLYFLDKEKPIQLWIHSQGGDIRSGMAIIDVMENLPICIESVCMGKAYSMAALILACGEKRKALKHARMMIHEPYIYKGQSVEKEMDLTIHLAQMREIKEEVITLLQKHTKNDKQKIEQDLLKDFYMNSEEAIQYGLIDEVVGEVNGR